MLTCNPNLDEQSTWKRTTPGAHELAQPFMATEQGDFIAQEGFVATCAGGAGYELLYTLAGTGVVEQGNRSTKLEAGQALLVPCEDAHRCGTASGADGWHVLWARIDGAGVRELADLLEARFLRPVAVPEDVARAQMDAIAAQIENPDVSATVAVGLAIHTLLATMVAAAQEAGGSAGDEAIARVRERIERDYAQNITLEDLAAAAEVSASYLLKIFRKNLGATPYEYLLRYRITRAKQLLAETDERVGEIARIVGFNSESNFSFRFSKIVGQSPRAYRANCLGRAKK